MLCDPLEERVKQKGILMQIQVLVILQYSKLEKNKVTVNRLEFGWDRNYLKSEGEAESRC